MTLSPAAGLAIRGVVVLAERYGEGPVTLRSICDGHDLPKQYLVKLFSLLAKADVITAVRGKRGGYMLSREPDRISLLEIVEAVEGPVALNLCLYSPPRCNEVGCPMRIMWADLQSIFRDKLKNMKIHECITSAVSAGEQ